MNFLELDHIQIFEEQKAAFQFLFESVDLNQVVFVGGVADYLNLRAHYAMPVHDIDLMFFDENVVNMVRERLSLRVHKSKFYACEDYEVHVGTFTTNGKQVHVDFFRPNFTYGGLATSELLGRQVQHSCFHTMQRFHNDHVERFTSGALGKNYEWKRLYKHSRKASLYNLATYKLEKNQVQLDDA